MEIIPSSSSTELGSDDIAQLLARFDGRQGVNRSMSGRAQIEAQTDIEALRAWLARYIDSPRTYANYRKEAERLLLWAVLERRKDLSSLSLEDILAYRLFLADPQPAHRWVAQGRARPARHHAAWRPFAGPLSESSRNQALLILNSLFSWLVQAGYLAGNPLALSHQGRRQKKASAPQQRYLSRQQWRWVQDYIQSLSEDTPSEHRHKARVRWLFSILYGGALRISELIQARMADVQQRPEAPSSAQWWLQIHGKGDKWRRVPLTQELYEELMRYRQAHDLQGPPQALEPYPLLMSSGASDKHLSRAMAHVLVKQVFQGSADRLRSLYPDQESQARVLEQASAHWLRHSAGSHLADQGVDLRIIRDTLGHESIATTNIYLHAGDDQRHRALEQSHRLGWD
ncbi:tyrosine-type recombinase/integrase [Alcaligenes ammonioxydans]|uniref:tyrosine-type recombinase/integrase n=1 Tax=Alcaligenes ammonioxydans TaxID=2582914 RepID=UPI001F05D43B|nr:tyrosine-type recombinase/integrase [Alcaligenes ammonioxydans]MCH1878526.1 tyrosine-type recombinase/integrase [Alcaligenes ammonioxydans]